MVFGSVNGVVKCGRRFIRYVDCLVCFDFVIWIFDVVVCVVVMGVCMLLVVFVLCCECIDDGGDVLYCDCVGC